MANPKKEDLFTHNFLQTSKVELQSALAISTLDIVSYALSKISEIDPERVIYAEADSPDRCILAGDVLSKVTSVAVELKARGIQVGDCVCIHSFNCIWYPIFWLAIISIGGIVTGTNPAFTSTELAYYFKITRTKFIVAQPDCLSAVKEAVSNDDTLLRNIILLGDRDALIQPGLASNNTLDHNPGNFEGRVNFDDKAKQDTSIAVYAATSGTTGFPKAAELSHKYLVAQATILEHVFSKREQPLRQLVCLPIFHAFAAQLAIVLPLRLGFTTYFMRRFNIGDYTNYVFQFQITDSAVVPPIIGALLEAQPHLLSSLRYMICAGAPMTAAIQTKLYSNLSPSAIIAQCWGTTEHGWTTLFGNGERDHTGSVGRLLPNTNLKIVDEFGSSVTADDVAGEARIKSESMFKRYCNDPDASATAFDEEGYYCTGDRVYVQNDKIFIDGRIKDTLKVNGWQVSPAEIERVILELDDIIDCAVTGHTVINEKTGLEETKPRAFIVRKTDSEIGAAQVQKHVSEHLVRYKRLSGGVVIVDAIPRSNTGKILRRNLIEIPVQHNGQTDLHRQEQFDILRHFAAIVLIPLCFALGVPGVIILSIGVMQIMLGAGGNT